MKKGVIICVAWLAGFSSAAFSSEQIPAGVSPGSETGIASVGQVCPTFSWTAVENAVAYRIEIYYALEGEYSHDEMAFFTNPVQVQDILGAATSWTPSKEERLDSGGLYVWFVRAVDEYGSGAWSKSRMFRIEAGTGFAAVEEAVSATLEEHGIDKDIIQHVLGNLNEAATLYRDGSSSGNIPISIQGTEGQYITKYGYEAGLSTTETYAYDTFVGIRAGRSNTTGIENTYLGNNAGRYGTTGDYNTALGGYAGWNNNANGNVFVGYGAGRDNFSGEDNTIVGTGANFYNDTGSYNSIFGRDAGYNNEASSNTFFGALSGISNTTGYENIFMGREAGFTNTLGVRNVFIGTYAGYANTDADHGTFLGHYAGYKNTTGNFNTFLVSWSGRKTRPASTIHSLDTPPETAIRQPVITPSSGISRASRIPLAMQTHF